MLEIGELKDAHRGQKGVVIGNGHSRLRYDLKNLCDGAISVGCNAVIRDISPNYVVAVDGATVEQIWNSDTCPILTPRQGNGRRKHRAYLWRHCSIVEAHELGDSFNLSKKFVKGISGVIALQSAILMGCDPIVLVGMEHCLEPGTKSHSVYFGQGIPYYESTGPIGHGPTVACGKNLVPISWLDSIARIWWICWRYGRERAIHRIDSSGVLGFLPTVSEPGRPIDPPPTINIEEFRRAFPTLQFHQHAGGAAPSGTTPS